MSDTLSLANTFSVAARVTRGFNWRSGLASDQTSTSADWDLMLIDMIVAGVQVSEPDFAAPSLREVATSWSNLSLVKGLT